MNLFLSIILFLGIALVIFGIITFYGKNRLSKKSHFFSGVEIDHAVIGIALFMLGMIFVIIFLIEVMGPHFVEEGL